MITDNGSIFNFQVISEVAALLGLTLKQATTKDTQTILVPARTHTTIKNSLKRASGEYRKQWHNYPPLAFLNYNTSYHTSQECERTKCFQSRVLYNTFDQKLRPKFDPNLKVAADFADELLRRTQILYNKFKKNVMQLNVRYKVYYDKEFVVFANSRRTTKDKKSHSKTSDGLVCI